MGIIRHKAVVSRFLEVICALHFFFFLFKTHILVMEHTLPKCCVALTYITRARTRKSTPISLYLGIVKSHG